MKTNIYTILTGMFLGVMFTGHAAVLRVNNDLNVTAPYSTFAAAQTAASPGDTIYLEGTSINYGSISLTKKLVIIGTGYFLDKNPETQSNINAAFLGGISFISSAANGTKLMGLWVSSITFNVPNLQGIEISRNYIGDFYTYYSSNEISIKQNYFYSGFSAVLDNSIVCNNLHQTVSITSSSNSVAFYNNVVTSSLNLANCLCFNNIMTAAGASFINTNTYNNLCSATQFPAGNNNQQNVNMSTVFECFGTCTGYSPDGKYLLKAGSPAIGAGANGEDCGMFGGSEPYVLSGMPAIPAIYSFQYNNNNSVINVTMSAKSHN